MNLNPELQAFMDDAVRQDQDRQGLDIVGEGIVPPLDGGRVVEAPPIPPLEVPRPPPGAPLVIGDRDGQARAADRRARRREPVDGP